MLGTCMPIGVISFVSKCDWNAVASTCKDWGDMVVRLIVKYLKHGPGSVFCMLVRSYWLGFINGHLFDLTLRSLSLTPSVSCIQAYSSCPCHGRLEGMQRHICSLIDEYPIMNPEQLPFSLIFDRSWPRLMRYESL